ncbi:hypothetical protein LEN26_008160 [Aphanomyces euteiches]|nr:hypothetical protein LEN26_020466 [Aphanomyces euteiches]KAH9113689.1 hypothetical protein AeMF1_012148 [Aphanomyces euteiches]KAH9130831.1 hypothetical protein LEN26_008160 [Aphanomyces euteiches]KAH9185074.1 hypothetical protein AeNC1_012950 [Aphanomyces euteiches]
MACLSHTLATLALAAAVVLSQTQVHLGLTTSTCVHGVSVNFASLSSKPETVKYGVEGATKTKAVETTTDSYKVGSYKSPHLHQANLCNLEPNTKYSYSVGTFQSTFTTPPDADDSTDATVLGILGDVGLKNVTMKTFLTPYKSSPIQTLVIVGDYSYANGNHTIWDEWYDLQEPVLSKFPSIGIVGNHEVVRANKGFEEEKYLGYLKRAASPITTKNADALRTYYSVDIGLVHCVFLDDYVGSSFEVGSKPWLRERNKQLSWFKADLKAVDRATTPYIVVFKHNPFYNTWDDHQCLCSESAGRYIIPDKDDCWRGNYEKAAREPHCGLQAKLEDVYAANQVDIVISGHVHGFERTAALYKNKIDPVKGSVYMTTGAGGASHVKAQIQDPPAWSEFTDKKSFGASRLIATKKKLQVLWFTDDDLENPKDKVEIRPRA